MADVALITIHGMGRIKPDYFRDLEDGLVKILGRRNWDRVAFRNVQYASVLQGPQDELWAAMLAEGANELDARKTREFFLFGFGDGGSLEYSAQKDPRRYIAVQKKIQEELLSAFAAMDYIAEKPVVIIAQSLGCQVISNYLWDAQYGRHIFAGAGSAPRADFLKLKSLRNLITTGCNIPLFVGGLGDRVCFAPPHLEFTWDNYYDKDDVLGWPLRQLGRTYEVVNDRAIKVGGVLTSWNLASHTGYWSDKAVIAAVAARILQRL